MKLSPVPSEFSALPGVSVAGGARGAPFRSPGGLPENGAGYHRRPHPISVSNAEVPLPCLRLFGRGASRPDAAVVLYAMSTAVREALPLWLLAGVQAGGIGASPPRVGVVFAAGAFVAEAGRWCVSCLRERENGGGAWRRLTHVVWARLASVAGLGLLFLLPKFLPSWSSVGIPPDVVWLAVTLVVATNYASLDLCTAAAAAALAVRSQQQRPEYVSGGMSSSSHDAGGGDEGRTRAKSSASSDLFAGGNWRPPPEPRSALVTSGSILFVGDVLGSTAGPLVLALALWTGCRSPLDASFWIVVCLLGDLWLAVGTREVEPRHARLLGGEDEEEEEEERRRAQRFAQFV